MSLNVSLSFRQSSRAPTCIRACRQPIAASDAFLSTQLVLLNSAMGPALAAASLVPSPPFFCSLTAALASACSDHSVPIEQRREGIIIA